MYDRPFYDFNEKMDLDPKHRKAWVLGSQWYPPPPVPLFTDFNTLYGNYAMQWAAGMINDPRTKGWEHHYYRGANYLTLLETNEEERKQLEPLYRETMRKVLEDPWEVWQKKYKPVLKETLNKFLAADLSKIKDVELASHFLEVWHFGKLVEEAHMYPMYALGAGNLLFRKLLKQLLNISPSDVVYAELHSGFDNEFNTVIEELNRVSSLALDLGLANVFQDSEPEELLSKLENTEQGKRWVVSFNELLDKCGWMRRRGMEFTTPTWWEDKTIPLKEIKRYVAQGKTSAGNVNVRPHLIKRRKEVEKELLNKIPIQDREVFQKLMECSQASHVFSEEHTMYVEMMYFTAVRLAAMEFGHRFAAKGMIDRADNILYLNHEEIVYASIVQEKCDVRSLVNKRLQEYEKYRTYEGTLPPVMGDASKIPEMVSADITFSVAMGTQIATPEEVGASLVGCAGSPGVVEGVACVCFSDEDIDKIKPDSILVAPAAAASWTPVFNIVKGVITDSGGYLTHSIIVAREFGIPAVVGTQEATKKIKTGQKVRIDGNLCRVYILD